MKAMILHETGPIESGPLRYEDAEMPSPGPGEIVMKVGACGVCRSNLQVIEGERGRPPKLPLIPGHEVVGRITELGQEVNSLKIGDRVGAQPQFSVCGKCEYCSTGRENLCTDSKRFGWSTDGGYSEYMRGFAAHVHKVPDNISDIDAAPLFCPGVTAYRAVKESGISSGKKVAIFGIGGVGHMTVQFARLAGARVAAVSRNPIHTHLASEMGADEVLISSKEDPVRALSRDGGVDASIVFAPSDDAISQAIQSTKKGGTIVIGVDGSIRNYNFMKGQTIKGTVVGTREDINEVLSLAAKGLVHVKAKEYKLEKANDVLKELKGNRVDGRVVLTP
ncbi:MAG TPA: alcohol dehydrogenase catalytic domain-containing protein [Candidatus Saccharimonadales bacterium]|nr:alcohol dehydrogenase catalytic domain-containing protein [Candidatus Saccharimonadales bacterium]